MGGLGATGPGRPAFPGPRGIIRGCFVCLPFAFVGQPTGTDTGPVPAPVPPSLALSVSRIAALFCRRCSRRKGRVQMTDASDPGESLGNPSKPINPHRPKRGAFPTPKPEIEKAKPYIPDMGEEENRPEGKTDRQTDADDEKES